MTPTGVPLDRGSAPPNKTNVWRAIFELWELLRAQINAETAYQGYFERNPVVFDVLGFDTHASFEKSSGNSLPVDPERMFRPEPDFLCAETAAAVVTVFELKTPFVGPLVTARSSDGNRAKLREQFSSYVAQAKEYVAAIQGSSEARQIVQRALGLDRISEYQIVLVCGLAEENDAAQITQVLTGTVPAIRVLHFDGVLDQLADEYERQYRGVESRAGWATVYHLGFPETPVLTREYISDGGAKERDRISLFREGEDLFAECLDSAGRAHSLRAHVTPGIHYILFEFSTDATGIYMSLTVDDDLQALVLGRTQFKCDPDMSNYIFGGDLDGACGGEFDMYQSLFIGRTLSLEEKLGMYGYALEKIASATGTLHFDRSSFMRSVPEGALIQSDEALRPTLLPMGVKIGRINSQVPSNAPKPRSELARRYEGTLKARTSE